MMRGFWWRFWVLVMLVVITITTSQVALLNYLETR